MRAELRFIAIVLLGSFLFSQQKYLSTTDIEKEWKDYTSYQRDELVSLATFLFDEGFYDRALLSYFQYIYKYPKDDLELAAYFQIAKCYENMGSWDLAKNYYKRIIGNESADQASHSAAAYQLLYVDLVTKNFKSVIDAAFESQDPYKLIFKAYAHFEMLEFGEAKASFRAAESYFNLSHYSKLIKPWYRAIKTAENAPLKGKTSALLSSIAPGGGFIYLKQKENAIGAMASSFLLYGAIASVAAIKISKNKKILISKNKQNFIPNSLNIIHSGAPYAETEIDLISINRAKYFSNYKIPKQLILVSDNSISVAPAILVAIGLHAGSMWKSFYDIDEANKRLVSRYTLKVSSKLNIGRFMDYELPLFVIK